MAEPIIVIGAARSGTKWVRSLLASTGSFRVVPYDVNYIWRSGQHALPHDVLSPAIGDRQAARIRSLLDRVALPSPQGPGQPMLEKTVSNALRVPFVRRVFPGARFVEIVRDGREAIASTFEQWNRPMERSYGLRKALAVPPACWPYLIQLGLRSAGVARSSRSWGSATKASTTTSCGARFRRSVQSSGLPASEGAGTSWACLSRPASGSGTRSCAAASEGSETSRPGRGCRSGRS